MMKLYFRYKEVILYIFFGGCATLVNIVSYYICSKLLGNNTISSTIIAWGLSVLFAYVTNRVWVFESKTVNFKVIIYEILAFISCRLISGVIDLIIMYICVDILGLKDMIIKIASNVLIIIINYFASKLLVFKAHQN